MLGFEFKGFTDLQRGYLSLLFGSILLLHTLDIFEKWLDSILVLSALFFIAYGIIKTQFIRTAAALIQTKEAPKNSDNEDLN